MAIQHDPGLHVYVSKSDIPSYQRDWVWGTAVLFVFICGLLTTWLLTPYFGSSRHLFGQVGQGEIGAEEVLARQETNNQRLQTQLARLEALLSSEDVCSADTVAEVQRVLDAVTDP